MTLTSTESELDFPFNGRFQIIFTNSTAIFRNGICEPGLILETYIITIKQIFVIVLPP